MAKIKSIRAREILDSRGNPTVSTAVELDDDTIGIANCPSGASVGTYEAYELRDQDSKRYLGLGVLKAVNNVENVIAPKLKGVEITNQGLIDKTMIELDGTPNKSRLGANAILSVSIAATKAAAKSEKLPLYMYLKQFIKETDNLKMPLPAFNLINGGKHAGNNLDFQEFIIIPASSKPYTECLEIGVSIYHALKTVLIANNFSTLVGDEGGYGVPIITNADPFFLLKEGVETAGYRLGFDAFLGLDAAANSFYKQRKYNLRNKISGFSTKELINYYLEINNQYHLLYLEDPLAEDDWEGWTEIVEKLGQSTIIVGDDLTVTNPLRLQMALNKKAITGIIIKPNQIGTVIETIAVVEMAKQMGLKITVSHRSGETNDDFIADFAVAVGADYAKFGAPARGERTAKYNRLLEIAKQLQTVQ